MQVEAEELERPFDWRYPVQLDEHGRNLMKHLEERSANWLLLELSGRETKDCSAQSHRWSEERKAKAKPDGR